MYTTIIFDFFDVIRTDDYKAWLRLHDYKLEGQFLEAVQKQDRGEIDVQGFLALLSEMTGQTVAEISEEMDADAAIDYDILALITKLRGQYKIGLLSNAPKDFLRDCLKQNDLEKYFDEIVISSEVGLIKPHPEIFEHILAQMNAKPEQTIFIDDNQHNVDGANTVGIRGILYTDIQTLRTDFKTSGVM